ncbi:MAG: hypothetical protein EOP87_03735 [Verrucomicrobiaceae bacterium]|nr:MAG: hypothetical protein EOP87_03735 [Verrucomicrobiaceae bacterium]
MFRNCCPACSGIGSYYGTEWVRDDSQALTYKRVTRRKDCDICGGSGRVMEGQPLHTQRCVTLAERPSLRSRDERKTGRLDRFLGWTFSVALFGYVVFRLSKQPFLWSGWPGWGIALLAAMALPWLLEKISGSAWRLRRVALLGLLLAVSGGIVFEFALR